MSWEQIGFIAIAKNHKMSETEWYTFFENTVCGDYKDFDGIRIEAPVQITSSTTADDLDLFDDNKGVEVWKEPCETSEWLSIPEIKDTYLEWRLYAVLGHD